MLASHARRVDVHLERPRPERDSFVSTPQCGFPGPPPFAGLGRGVAPVMMECAGATIMGKAVLDLVFSIRYSSREASDRPGYMR
jgi:hypothetical protein